MKHTYTITGMTCESCVNKVTDALNALPSISRVAVHKKKQTVEVDMTEHVSLEEMNTSLATKGAYRVQELSESVPVGGSATQQKLKTYYPLLLVLGYIILSVVLYNGAVGYVSLMESMRVFMGAFFLAFSFFKLLDIPGFASSYRTYDIVTKRFPGYGYVYPFLELFLGIAYLSSWNVWFTSVLTLILMSVSIVGVIQSVREKRAIKCACLGTVFNLPMTTVTIVEDGVMILMALIMLVV